MTLVGEQIHNPPNRQLYADNITNHRFTFGFIVNLHKNE